MRTSPLKGLISSPVKHDMFEDVKQADGTTKKFPVKHKHKVRPKTSTTKATPEKPDFPPIGVEVVI